MIISTASLAGLAFAALLIAAVYPLVVGSLAATTYATEHRFPPAAEESSIDPDLLFDLGLAGTMLGFLVAIGLLAWLGLASSRDTAVVTGEGR